MLKRPNKQDSNEGSPLEFPKALMPYVQKAPLPVLVRSTLEWMLQQATLEQLFEDTAQDQYTRELTLTFLVDLMLDVASGIQPSALKAFNARSDDLAISRQALYAKRFFRQEFGTVSQDVYLPDCFGFGFALPSWRDDLEQCKATLAAPA